MTSGEGTRKIFESKLTYQFNLTVQLADGDGWHFHAIEPILLYHCVTGRIDEGQAITDLQRLVEPELTEDIAGQTGLAADHVLMGAVTGLHARRLTVDQQVQHVRFDRAVDHRQLLAVIQGVQHRNFQRGAHGNGSFARLQIDLNPILLGELFQTGAELVQWIAFASEVDTTTQADPLDSLQQITEAFLDLPQHAVEQVKVTVFAIVVDHKTGDLVDHLLHLLRIPLAQSAERPRRVGNQPVGTADLRIEPQTTGVAGRSIGETLQLADGVEDDLVRMGQDLGNLIIGVGH